MFVAEKGRLKGRHQTLAFVGWIFFFFFVFMQQKSHCHRIVVFFFGLLHICVCATLSHLFYNYVILFICYPIDIQ